MTDDHVCLFYGEPIERTRTDPCSAIPDRRVRGGGNEANVA